MRRYLAAFLTVAVGFGCAGLSQAAELGGVDIHAFASQGFIQSTTQNNFPVGNSGQGSFNFNEFGINFSKQITPELRVGMQLFAQDRGNYGKDEVTLDWGYGDYRYADWLGFRAGKIKNPMGLYNETRDTDSLRTFILLPQSMYSDQERETTIALSGAGIYGELPLGPVGKGSYQLQVGALPLKSDGGTAQIIAGHLPGGGNPTAASSKTTVSHNLEWRPPVDGLRLAVSGLHSTFHVEADNPILSASENLNNFHRYIFSAEYTWLDLILAGEYMKQDFDFNVSGTTQAAIPAGVLAPVALPAGFGIASTSSIKNDAWYVSATYRINELFETGAYYSEYYADRGDRSKNYQKDTALTLRLDPVKNLVIKVEGHLLDGTTQLIQGPSNADAKQHWYIFATKATYSF